MALCQHWRVPQFWVFKTAFVLRNVQMRGHGGPALLRAEGRHGAAGGGLGQPRGGKHDAVHGGGL